MKVPKLGKTESFCGVLACPVPSPLSELHAGHENSQYCNHGKQEASSVLWLEEAEWI